MKRENLIITGKVVSFVIVALISLVALYFSYFAYQMRQENLHVSLPEGRFFTDSNFEIAEHHSDFEIEEALSLMGGPIWLLSTNIDVTISNISDLVISLTSFASKSLFDGGGVFFSGTDRIANLKTLNLPITLESGHSKKLKLKISLPVAREVVPMVQSYVESCESRSLWSLRLYLAVRGTDFMGNKNVSFGRGMKEEELETPCPEFGGVLIKPSDVNPKKVLLLMEFGTPRGNRFLGEAEWK